MNEYSIEQLPGKYDHLVFAYGFLPVQYAHDKHVPSGIGARIVMVSVPTDVAMLLTQELKENLHAFLPR